MKILSCGLLALCFAFPLRAQTIATQLVSQTVQVGQSATFTVTVTGGPCNSLWIVNGVGHSGDTGSTISWVIPNAQPADNGTKISVMLYPCTGGPAVLITRPAILTVISCGCPPLFTSGVYPLGASVDQKTGIIYRLSDSGDPYNPTRTDSGFRVNVETGIISKATPAQTSNQKARTIFARAEQVEPAAVASARAASSHKDARLRDRR